MKVTMMATILFLSSLVTSISADEVPTMVEGDVDIVSLITEGDISMKVRKTHGKPSLMVRGLQDISKVSATGCTITILEGCSYAPEQKIEVSGSAIALIEPNQKLKELAKKNLLPSVPTEEKPMISIATTEGREIAISLSVKKEENGESRMLLIMTGISDVVTVKTDGNCIVKLEQCTLRKKGDSFISVAGKSVVFSASSLTEEGGNAHKTISVTQNGIFSENSNLTLEELLNFQADPKEVKKGMVITK